MDNFNGQNPMGGNQYQQPVQQQAPYQQPVQQQVPYQQPTQQAPYQQQMQYQQPMQGQYQQPAYQNGYYAQPNYAKPKSGAMKWVLIIGVPAFLAVAILITIFIISIIFPSYDIDDYDTVYDACYEAVDIKIKKNKDAVEYYKEEGIISMANGSNETSNYEAMVIWFEFADEDDAEKYFNEQSDDLKEEYEDDKDDYETRNWKSSKKYTEATLGEDGEVEKGIIIREDEYVMIITFEGKKSVVEDVVDDLLDELD